MLGELEGVRDGPSWRTKMAAPKTAFADLLGAMSAPKSRYPHTLRLEDRVLGIRAITPDTVLYDALCKDGKTLMDNGSNRAMTPRGFVRYLAKITETAFA